MGEGGRNLVDPSPWALLPSKLTARAQVYQPGSQAKEDDVAFLRVCCPQRVGWVAPIKFLSWNVL